MPSSSPHRDCSGSVASAPADFAGAAGSRSRNGDGSSLFGRSAGLDDDDGFDDRDDGRRRNRAGGIPSIVSDDCVPLRLRPRDETRRRSRRSAASSTLPVVVLLSLVLYGFLSAVADVATSLRSFRDARERRRVVAAESGRFPGAFRSDGSSGASSAAGGSKRAMADYDAAAQFSVGARSVATLLERNGAGASSDASSSPPVLDDPRSLRFPPPDGGSSDRFPPHNVDADDPRPEDVPALTERVLSTTFARALDLEEPAGPDDDEVQFFWVVGATPGAGPAGRLPAKIARCFPNVVQAGGGFGGGGEAGGSGSAGGVPEEELRGHAHELRVLQRAVPPDGGGSGGNGDDGGPRVEGLRYVNVDLFAPDGVRRAADLGLLFPERPFRAAHENERHAPPDDAAESAGERGVVGAADEDVDASAAAEGPVAASSQIGLLESGFLPEIMGLFAPPPGWTGRAPPPAARIHAIFPPTQVRISLYYKFHRKDLFDDGAVTYLQFVTSPSIVANNYVTRILSGRWEEGSPLTEVHLEVAKNVMSRKVRLWPNQGAKDLVSHWADRCGWQEGAAKFRQRLLDKYGDGIGLHERPLGLECMFPPPDPNENATKAWTKKAPSELDREINDIVAERNRLDAKLFAYAVKLYKSRATSAASRGRR